MKSRFFVYVRNLWPIWISFFQGKNGFQQGGYQCLGLPSRNFTPFLFACEFEMGGIYRQFAEVVPDDNVFWIEASQVSDLI